MKTATAVSPEGSLRGYADEAEVSAVVAELGRFERGEIGADEWRAYRVLRGVYSQRQGGVYMLRVKIPQGIATAGQLRALAEVATRWARGRGHVTTRQDVQFHFVQAADLGPTLRHLADAGITTTGAGGNAVRNVVACPFAGVSPGEPFDVTPYAEAVTRHFLRHPLASSLPRKFKIAFEGCPEDHVATPIHDLGFRALLREVRGRAFRGFSVTLGGGTSTSCRSGGRLLEFLPAGEVLALAEAVVRVFHARGDRKNKHRNRLKFLVGDLGFAAVRELVEGELAVVRREGAPPLPFSAGAAPEERRPPRTLRSPAAPAPEGLTLFERTNVRAQRQQGFAVVTVAPPQGQVTAAQLECLAELAVAFGDGTVRLGIGGPLHLRWIRRSDVPAVFQHLASAGLGRAGAGSAGDVVACPGSEVCQSAVTRTRDLARLVEKRVRQALGEPALAEPATVRVSGCPNGCAQHHLAAIGLQGGARKLGSRALPQYFVLLGGGVDAGGARFGELAGKVPARCAAEAVERLVALWLAERDPGEPAAAYFARSIERARAAISDLQQLRVEDARAEDFIEPGATEVFRPEATEGECAA